MKLEMSTKKKNGGATVGADQIVKDWITGHICTLQSLSFFVETMEFTSFLQRLKKHLDGHEMCKCRDKK